MGDVHADIKPGGLNDRLLARFLYQFVASLAGMCAKLDADGGVTDTDYEANGVTACITGKIEDDKGNSYLGGGQYMISPRGITPAALNQALYEIHNAFETITEQLDADAGITATDAEANCYTACFLHKVRNKQGLTLGQGNFTFTPGNINQDMLVDWMYNALNAQETLTEQLDADGDVTDTNYEALWYTASCTLKVMNGAGLLMGN